MPAIQPDWVQVHNGLGLALQDEGLAGYTVDSRPDPMNPRAPARSGRFFAPRWVWALDHYVRDAWGGYTSRGGAPYPDNMSDVVAKVVREVRGNPAAQERALSYATTLGLNPTEYLPKRAR